MGAELDGGRVQAAGIIIVLERSGPLMISRHLPAVGHDATTTTTRQNSHRHHTDMSTEMEPEEEA